MKPGVEQVSSNAVEGRSVPWEGLRVPLSLCPGYPPLPPSLEQLFFIILHFHCLYILMPTTLLTLKVLDHDLTLISLRSIPAHNCHVLTWATKSSCIWSQQRPLQAQKLVRQHRKERNLPAKSTGLKQCSLSTYYAQRQCLALLLSLRLP